MGIIYGTSCGVQTVNTPGSTITGTSGGGGYVYDILRTPINIKDLKMAVSRRENMNKFLTETLGIEHDPTHDDVVLTANREFEAELDDYRKRNAIDLGEKPVDKKK